MIKQLSERQKNLLREGIEIGKRAIERADRIERLMDEIEQEEKQKIEKIND